MNKIKKLLKWLFIEEDKWYIALRARNGVPLYKGNGNDFILVKNKLRYWKADPFLFKYNDENYIFVELYDRKIAKGKIAVAKIDNAKCGKFQVCLNLPCHLSYPCVFENEGNIYMIPETCGANEIALFKAVEFPFKWEKERVIANMKGADTTPISFNEEVYFTIDVDNPYKDVAAARGKNLFIINNGKRYKIYDNNVKVRPAGHLIYDDNTIIRPAQDSSIDYGDGVIFYQIDNIGENTYKEHKLFEVSTINRHNNAEVIVNIKNSKKTFSGMHTYNVNEDFEIIDVAQRNVWNPFGSVHRFNKMIKGKLKNGK